MKLFYIAGQTMGCILSPETFLAAGPGYGTENFYCQILFSCWAWLWDFSGFQGFELFARVYACARVSVHMRARAKTFFVGGGDFLAFRARVRARVRIRARKPFSCYQGHFFSFFARACVRTRTHARFLLFFAIRRSARSARRR